MRSLDQQTDRIKIGLRDKPCRFSPAMSFQVFRLLALHPGKPAPNGIITLPTSHEHPNVSRIIVLSEYQIIVVMAASAHLDIWGDVWLFECVYAWMEIDIQNASACNLATHPLDMTKQRILIHSVLVTISALQRLVMTTPANEFSYSPFFRRQFDGAHVWPLLASLDPTGPRNPRRCLMVLPLTCFTKPSRTL